MSKRKNKKTNVSDLLTNIDEDLLKTLINFSKPSNKFGEIVIKDIMEWKFCDVVDIANKDLEKLIPYILSEYGYTEKESIKSKINATDKDILKGDAPEFISLVKHLQNEFKKASMIMEQLQSDPDPLMVNAGIEKLNRFGPVGIYYAIDKNPLSWDAISEIPFGKMVTKLMLDKVTMEIEIKKNELIQQQQKNRR